MMLNLRNWKLYSFLLLTLTAVWIVYSTVEIAPPDETGHYAPQIGQRAPLFTLSSIDGEIHSLEKEQGKIVVVNFFASWCPPCKAEMPAIQKTYATYHSSGLEIFGIANLQQDNLSELNSFLSYSEPQFPILLDENSKVYENYAIRAMPTTFLLDQNGRIHKIYYGGPLSEGLLAIEIERMMKGE